MAVEGERGDVLEYTRKWFQQVNRGGLFPLNDGTHLFIEIERCVHVYLYPVVMVTAGNAGKL